MPTVTFVKVQVTSQKHLKDGVRELHPTSLLLTVVKITHQGQRQHVKSGRAKHS